MRWPSALTARAGAFSFAAMLTIGSYELHSIETGRFRLDGGAMFGIVPRVVWEQVAPADERHRIQLSMRSLLAVDRRGGRAILVDSGAGDKWSPEEVDRFAFEVDGDRFDARLAGLGLSREQITDVVVTHLHFDHNGGLTRWADEAAERVEPSFPSARHWIHRRHLDHARSPTQKDRASFLARDFEPVADAGLFELLDGDSPSCPFRHVRWFVSHGHTPYQLLPLFDDGRRRLLFAGDAIPTFAHLPVPWVMAYDLEPLRTMEEKTHILSMCAREDLLLASEHDPELAAAQIDTAGKRPTVKQPIDL